MVVLGFLNNQPMHGYQIGQIISERKFLVWTGIKLPSIYKAMQTLEAKQYISGQELTEGNNPPRKVYTLSTSGKEYLRALLSKAISEEMDAPQDFWLAISFANNIFRKMEMLNLINKYKDFLHTLSRFGAMKHCDDMLAGCKAPFAHQHLFDLGDRIKEVQLKTITELEQAIKDDKYKDYFLKEGE
jgi:DNA-binding PadR family transcriptional regulator